MGHDPGEVYTVYRMMHQMLDETDQTRKYGISESMIQALYYDIVVGTGERGEIAAVNRGGRGQAGMAL